MGERPLGPSPQWNPEAVLTAVKYAGHSAPGPDGIPYSAYSCSPLAQAILQEAATYVVQHDTADRIPDDFNHSRLICLPKKPAGTTPEGEEYCTPDCTRPLSIVNTDNRLIAAAVKINLHDHLEAWISAAQQGFLNGRSMNLNILQVMLAILIGNQ